MNDRDSFDFITLKSQESRRATRSVLDVELIPFAGLLDKAFAINDSIEIAIVHCVQFHHIIGSKGLFDNISKDSMTYEKIKMLDLYAARKRDKEQDISSIGSVRSNQSISDRLTKSMNQKVLCNVITTEKIRL